MKLFVTTISALIVILLCLTGLYSFIEKRANDNFLQGTASNVPGFSSATIASVQVGPDVVSKEILAAKGGRWYAKFTNNSPNDVYINLGGTAADDTGFLMIASSTYEINKDNLFVGVVNGFSLASSSILITELIN